MFSTTKKDSSKLISFLFSNHVIRSKFAAFDCRCFMNKVKERFNEVQRPELYIYNNLINTTKPNYNQYI